MAHKKLQATATLFLDTSNAQSDAKKFVNDIKQKLAEVETAADKMSVFKDVVGYIAQIDRALTTLKAKNSDAFNSAFGNLDTDLKKQLEGIFGVDGTKLGQLDVLREKLNSLTPKSSIKEIRNFAKEINALFSSVGLDKPFDDINEQFSGRTTTKHIQDLAVTLAKFSNVWDDVSSRIAGGFGVGGTGSGSGGFSGLSKAIQEEIDKLKKQKEDITSLIKQIKEVTKMSSAWEDGDTINLDFEATEEAAQKLIDKFKQLDDAINNNEFDDESIAYAEALTERAKIALQLIEINNQLTKTDRNGKVIQSSPDFLKNFLADNADGDNIVNYAIEDFAAEAEDQLENLRQESTNTTKQINELKTSVRDVFGAAGNVPASDAFENIGHAAENAGDKVDTFSKKVDNLNESIKKVYMSALDLEVDTRNGDASGKEFMNLFSADGVVSTTEGIDYHVDTDTLVQQLVANLNRNIMMSLHNHANGDMTFSPSDINSFAKMYYGQGTKINGIIANGFIHTIDFNSIGQEVAIQIAQDYQDGIQHLFEAKNITQFASFENGSIVPSDLLKQAQVSNPEYYQEIIDQLQEAQMTVLRQAFEKNGAEFTLQSFGLDNIDELSTYLANVQKNTQNAIEPVEKLKNLISTLRPDVDLSEFTDVFDKFKSGAIDGSQALSKVLDLTSIDETNQKLREQEQLLENVKVAIKNGIGEAVGLDNMVMTLEVIEQEIKDGVLTSLEDCITRFREFNNINGDGSLEFVGKREHVIPDYYGTYLLGEDEVISSEEINKLRQLSNQQEQLYQNLRSAIKGTLSDVVDVDDMTYAFDTIEKEIQTGLLTTLDQCIEKFKFLTSLDDKRLAGIQDGQRVADEWDFYRGDISSDDYEAAERAAEAAQQRASEAEVDALRSQEEANTLREDLVHEREYANELAGDLAVANERIFEQNEALQRALDENVELQNRNEQLETKLAVQQEQPKDVVDSNEVLQLETLQQKLLEVRQAVDDKTKAFEEEYVTVDAAVDAEIASLNKLKEVLTEIQEILQVVFSVSKINVGDVELSQGKENVNVVSSAVQTIEQTLGQILAVLQGFTGLEAEGKNSIKHKESTASIPANTANATEHLTSKLNDLATEGTLAQIPAAIKNLADAVKLNITTSETNEIQDAPVTDPFKTKLSAQKGVFSKYRSDVQDADYLTEDLKKQIDSLAISLGEVSDQPGLDAWIKRFVNLKENVQAAKSEFEQMNLGAVNLFQRELTNSFNKLSLPQREDMLQEYFQAIVLLDKLKHAVKEGHAVEVAAIKDITAELQKKINAQIEANKAAKDATSAQKKNGNFGSTASINATAKYNSLIEAANGKQFANSSEIVTILNQYEQAYKRLITIRDELRNKDVIDDSDKEEFKRLTIECNNYASALEKVIKNTMQLKSKQNNSRDWMLGADFEDTKEGRIAALTDFVQEMYDVKLAASDFRDNWNEAVFVVDQGNGSFVQMTATFTDARNEIVALAGDTKKVAGTFESFFNELKGKFKSIFSYMIASFSFHEIWQVIKTGINYVREIDSALTELKKVTNETETSYDNFLQSMAKTGSVIGATVQDLTTMAADWARLGYSMEEAGKLAESTAILLNVSEFDDATKASEALISTMQAFGYTADESQHVVDILNEVGNNYAISSDGLAIALQDSASALMTAGASLEESVALIAAANKVVQDPSSVGGALRTISLRLRGTSVEVLEEMGEETEGVIESTSKLQEKIKALSGVDILSASGGYRSPYEILKDIAEVYESIDPMDQAALIELIAGKNRANTLAAILTNFEDLEYAYEDAMQAEGSALKENQAYLDSVQGHIDILNNSWQTMWMNAIDEDAIKWFAHLGDAIVKLIDNIGVLQTLFVSIGGIWFSKNFGSTLFGDIESAIKNVKQLQDAVDAARQKWEHSKSSKDYNAYQNELKNLEAYKIEFGLDDAIDSVEKLGDVGEETFEQLSFSLDNVEDTGEEVFEQLSFDLGDVEDATKNVGDIAEVSGGKMSAAFNKSKIAASGLWTQLKQLAKSMAIMYAVSAAFEVFGNIVTSATNAIKENSNSAEVLDDKYQEATDQLSQCESELRNLESELKTIKGQIGDLESQGTPTYAEQEELERLQSISEELERQIALKQTLQGSLQVGANANAVNAGNAYLNTSFDSEKTKTERQEEAEESGKKWGQGLGLAIGTAIGLGIAGAFTGGTTWAAIPGVLAANAGTIGLSAAIGAGSGKLLGGVAGTALEGSEYDQEQTVEEAINTMDASRDKLIKARDEAYEAYVSDPTGVKKMEEYEAASQALSLYDGKMADHITQMSQYYNTISSNWDTATDDQKNTANHYAELLDKYAIAMKTSGAKDNALDRIFGENANEEIQGIKEQILEAVDTSKDFDFTSAINSSQKLKDTLNYLGISAEDVKNYFTQIGEAAKNAVENNVSPVETYSSLIADIESYNEILSQTYEIVSDNTVVTQEYKDSLTDLGLSEEELADCFDENNDLIVKNADRLKDLIKKQKDEYKNNVKTAKSQAKLKYYKLAKDLVNTVKSTKNLTNTQRDHIKTILEEMDAVQDTISKYTMLESELLGVTNAYKKLADAQEIDSATDYGSKAEEMVNALANAFNTGELGTAAAEAAFEGLIPDWVVANAQSVDEAMESAYNYMKSGNLAGLFDIKYDDDGKLESVQMTLDKVKSFTGALIEADEVFHGTWDEFTLDPAIQNLDDFANAIGVTKEVAFAYLTELERYDASNIFGDSTTGLLDQLMGDNFDHVMQQASQKYAQAAADMLEEFDKVNEKVDMFNRKILYDDEGKMVTMASETFKASDFGLDGDFAFNVTPILPDGTKLENVEDYIYDHLASGGKLEDMDIFLGSYATLDEAIAKGERLSELQGIYYENQLAIEELENKALDFASAWGKTSDQLTDAREEAESLGRELAGAKNGVNESTGRTVEEIEADIKKNDQLISDLLSNLDKLKDEFGGEPTEMVVGVALDEVQEDIDNFKKDLEKKPAELKAAITEIDSTGFENLGLTKEADGSWSGLAELDWYQKLDPVSQEEVTNYLNMIESEHYLNLLMGDGVPTIEDHLQTISTVLQDIARMMNPTYTLHADTTNATNNVITFKNWWNSLGDKVVTLYQRTIGSWFGGGNVNGTANVGGSAYAGGKWGAKQMETSLVGELGPEMVVRGNRWFTVGENGAEFTQVKKGDIIFNHKQTEQLLENGHVTGRGKAYASGTAYAGVNTFTPYVPPSVSSGGNSNKDNNDDHDDIADDAEQVVDFIEMKLEEIEAIIEKTSTKISNFLDDTTDIKSKDELYDELVKAEKDKSAAYLKAAQKYNVEAAAALSGVPKKYQEMARNGAIAIEDFIGEDQVEIAEKIQEYRDWAAKADEAENGHLEAIAAISAHRVEQLEDIATDFENIISISKSHSDLLQAEMDFIEESGNRLSEGYYEELKKHSQKQLDDMQAERVALQKILDDAVAAGDVVIGSDDWYSMLESIYEVDKEIIDCKTSLEEFQNAINELHWDNFDKFINEIDNVNSELSNLYDLIFDDNKIVDEMGNWTDEGITSLGLLAQQMENAQFKSQQYSEAITKLKKDYADGLYSTDEYNEHLSELIDNQYDAIKSYEDAKDAIIDLNRTRIEAVKEGMQKEIDAYSELIEKKKESLNSDKEAYDFQKQVQESNKNIEAIERKIAALTGDTSSSAMAQRKRLEAELLKAKEEQQDLYYNHSFDKQQEALDKELEDYTKNKEDQMNALDEYLKKEEQVIADSYDLIAENTKNIANTLIQISEEYGVTISDAVATPWINGVNAIGTYQEQLNTSVSATTKNLEALKSYLEDLQAQADKTAESIVTATHSAIVNTNDGHQTSIKGYANGSKGVEYDQWAIIDELGDELQLVPNKTGRLDYIKKGTGILNNTLTEKLIDLAVDPTSMLENSKPVVGAPGITTTNNAFAIDASIGTLLHVEHLDGSNPAEVAKIVDKAWEKKMQTLNNSIKKFTR